MRRPHFRLSGGSGWRLSDASSARARTIANPRLFGSVSPCANPLCFASPPGERSARPRRREVSEFIGSAPGVGACCRRNAQSQPPSPRLSPRGRDQSSARASERNCFVVSMAACCESLIVGDGNARVSIAVVNQTLNQGLRAGRRLQCDSAKIEPALAETATGQARRQPKDPDFRPHGLASAATA